MMTKVFFIAAVALTFVGELAWSAWMVAPVDLLPMAWREAPDRTVETHSTGSSRLAWGRSDATLNAIITSAVWVSGTVPVQGGADRGVYKENGAPGEI